MKTIWIVAPFCLLMVSSAGAADAVSAAVASPDNVTISAKPWVEFLQPYLTAIATVVFPIIVAAIAQKVSSFLGVKMTATQNDQLKSAAATEAGALIASAADNLKNAVVNVRDPRVAAAAARIMTKLPETAASIGATPDKVALMVQGEIGKLQATASPATAVAVSDSGEGKTVEISDSRK